MEFIEGVLLVDVFELGETPKTQSLRMLVQEIDSYDEESDEEYVEIHTVFYFEKKE